MANTTVGPGQVSNGDVLNAGDWQIVYGVANNTIVHASAIQDIATNGVANNVQVEAGGYQYVGPYGSSFGTVLNGGSQSVIAFGIGHGLAIYNSPGAVGTVINAGGLQNVLNTSSGTVVNFGGIQTVHGNAFNTTINSGGLQIVDLTGLKSQVAIDGTIVENGGVQSIVVGSPTNTYLHEGGSVVFQQSNYADGGAVTLDKATDILTVADNGQVFTINLAGNYDATAFDVSSRDGHVQITARPLCFCKGTMLRTPQGDRPVEQLCPGDSVVTAAGAFRAIRWIGRSAGIVDAETRPVLVAANAFPNGTPQRDLRVTRGHSFAFEQVLIPIGQLINGTTIRWDSNARYVEVFHVELDRHDILLAEGAPAESYRDDGNRTSFHSGDGEAGRAMPTCMPVVASGPIVERTGRRLAERGLRMVAVNPRSSGAANW